MIERRRFFRFTKERRATYRVSGTSGAWQECTVIDFCRNGLKIFYQDTIDQGSLLRFDIDIPEENTTIDVTGTLQWTLKGENGFIGGIALTEIFDDDTFRKFLNEYE